jgi:hypothetical protein
MASEITEDMIQALSDLLRTERIERIRHGSRHGDQLAARVEDLLYALEDRPTPPQQDAEPGEDPWEITDEDIAAAWPPNATSPRKSAKVLRDRLRARVQPRREDGR